MATDGAALLGQFKGFWWAARNTPLDPTAPTFGSGCPVGELGQRFVLQGYWNRAAESRFGSELFGTGTFGATGDPGILEWQDMTSASTDATVTIGDQRYTANPQTDTLDFRVKDDQNEWFEWLPPGSLASPTIGTPFRVGFLDRFGNYVQSVMTRLERMTDLHESPDRWVEVHCAGTKTDLSTSILNPDRPRESVQERIQWTLDEIGWPWGVVWPLTNIFDTDLEADPASAGSQRTGRASFAWNVITEAANSAGHNVTTDSTGALTFQNLAIPAPVGPPLFTVVDCDPTPGQVVASTMVFTANAQSVLNVVQLQNRVQVGRSGEALDTSSIAIFGRRATGYGFPLVTVNQSDLEAQAIAEDILDKVAYLVNRVDDVVFSTATDPNWWSAMAYLQIGNQIDVLRNYPTPITFDCYITGFTFDVTNEYVEAQIHLMSLNETL
jgi:hypothetical protein